MLRIGRVVLCTCVFAPLLLLQYTLARPKLQPKCCAMWVQQLHKKRAAQSPSSPFACSTLQCCCHTCSLIRFLLSTPASPALGVELLLDVLASHAWWAYGYPVALCQPLFNGLGTHGCCCCCLLLGSCHTTSLCCGHPPHNYMQGGFGANARTRTGMPEGEGF